MTVDDPLLLLILLPLLLVTVDSLLVQVRILLYISRWLLTNVVIILGIIWVLLLFLILSTNGCESWLLLGALILYTNLNIFFTTKKHN